jgi:hypothetical protein
MTHTDDDMLEEQKKLLLSWSSVETTLKVFDDNAPVNSERKPYKQSFTQGVPSTIKSASIIYPDPNPKPHATANLVQVPNHKGLNWNFKFVTKLNPRDSPPRELLEEQTAFLFQQVVSGLTSLEVFTGDAPTDQVPHHGDTSYRQTVMTPALGGRTHPVYKDVSTQTTFAASKQDDNVHSATSTPYYGAFFRDLVAPFVELSTEGQLGDPQKQNVTLTKEIEKTITDQTPKRDNETVQNIVTEENTVISEIRKTLLKRKRQHDSSVNITCDYSSFIPPVRMTQFITETAEKLDMTTVTNVDTITVLFQHDTTFHTTKVIAPLSGRVTVKVMKCEEGKTKKGPPVCDTLGRHV